jgi:hypothetical protein
MVIQALVLQVHACAFGGNAFILFAWMRTRACVFCCPLLVFIVSCTK